MATNTKSVFGFTIGSSRDCAQSKGAAAIQLQFIVAMQEGGPVLPCCLIVFFKKNQKYGFLCGLPIF